MMYETIAGELQDVKKQLAFLTSCMMLQMKPIASEMLLSDYLRMWYKDFRVGKISPATLRKDFCNIENTLIPELGLYRLCDLTTIQLQNYFNGKTAPRQREHFFVLLKHALRDAVNLKLLPESPMQSVIIPKYVSVERKPLNQEEERRFFEAAQQSKYADIYMILRYEGIRPGELLALEGKQVGMNKLKIVKAIDTLGNVKEPKTRAGKREIPIFPEAREILRKYADKPGILFPVSLYTLEQDFRAVRDRAGIDSDFVLYGLRHTFITRCAEKGVHPKIVQKWAGHSTLEMTLKYYTHISAEWEQAELAKLVDVK